MKRSPDGEAELTPEVRDNIPANGLRIVSANAMQSSGDQLVNASTVLPWLFATLGVPHALTGLLVPIRESVSRLPQAFLTPLVLLVEYRKRSVIAGALIQPLPVGAMVLVASLDVCATVGVSSPIALAATCTGWCL